MVASKPIVTVFVHRSREPMMSRLSDAIDQRNEDALDRAEVTEEPTQPGVDAPCAPDGLVRCDQCGVPVQDRGGHYAVHFPDTKTNKPCERSWPPKPVKKP